MKLNCKIIIISLLFPLASFALQVDKGFGYKRLEKKYEKGKIDKCKKIAKKYYKKKKNLNSAYFFLSKIELDRYDHRSDKSLNYQWSSIRKAINYSEKIDSSYIFWHNEVKDSTRSFILKVWEIEKNKALTKKALKIYVNTYNDTLDIYSDVFAKTEKENPLEVDIIPVTDSLRNEILIFAKELVGIPYKYAGEKPETGFDCSGFTKYVYSHIGIDLPHSAHMQSKLKGKNKSIEEAEPGDLIFFGSRTSKGWRTQHAGIYFSKIKNEIKVIHCVSRGVSIDGDNSSWEYYWKDKVLFLKELPQLKSYKND